GIALVVAVLITIVLRGYLPQLRTRASSQTESGTATRATHQPNPARAPRVASAMNTRHTQNTELSQTTDHAQLKSGPTPSTWPTGTISARTISAMAATGMSASAIRPAA